MTEGISWSCFRITTTAVYCCKKRDAKSLCYFNNTDNTCDQKIIRGSYFLKLELLFLS